MGDDDGSSTSSTTGEEVTTTTTGSTNTEDSTSSEGDTISLDTTATEGGSETTTTGPPPMCDEPDGTYLGACPEDSPFCVRGMCEDCDNDDEETSCEVANGAPGTVCSDDGRCVVCTDEEATACSGGTPVCDPGTNACVPCTEHAQCGASACNLFTGECVGGMVVNAVPGPSSLTNAVTALGPAGGTIIVAEGTYDESITIGGGAIIAFLPNAGASLEWQRTMGVGAPQLRVTDGATVLIDGFHFLTNVSLADPALRVDNANLWVDRSRISQNVGISLSAELDANVRLRNCFVAGPNDLPAINAVSAGNLTIQYSTVGGNFGASNAILCDAASLVTVSDSIILTRGTEPEVVCPMLQADHTAANTTLPGAGNVEVGATDMAWFVNYNIGDFHLVGDGPTTFQDVAAWNVGDPLVDIDGEARAGVEGEAEQPGADLP